MTSFSSVLVIFFSAIHWLLVASKRHDDGSDLSFYISRPDIRAAKTKVIVYDKDAVRPGYIFTSPYHTRNDILVTGAFIPGQMGPQIYDNNGDLIWSGAGLTDNHMAMDFKTTTFKGQPHLSVLRRKVFPTYHPDRVSGLIIDWSYRVIRIVDISNGSDIHEFSVLDDGASFLRVFKRFVNRNDIVPGDVRRVLDTCASEIDALGQEIFLFCPSDHLAMNETRPDLWELAQKYKEIYQGVGFNNQSYHDFFHMNSVAKFAGGDYLVSIRHTCGIYKVSGTSGELIWRLGGTRSDFSQDFDFCGQHDARIISQNDTVTVVSFFDNAFPNMKQPDDKSATVTSFKVVALYDNESPKRATLLKKFDRPDGKLTTARGNGQYLPDGGAFVGWSKQSYFSEFAPDGHLVMDFMFEADRFDSYRTYKFDFVGMPDTLPDLTSIASVNSRGKRSLTSYVSWNGATLVATWEFFGCDDEDGEYESLGVITKGGFETSFIAKRPWKYTWVRARDKNGGLLGESATVETDFPHSAVGLVADEDHDEELLEPMSEVQTSSALPPNGLPGSPTSQAEPTLLQQPPVIAMLGSFSRTRWILIGCVGMITSIGIMSMLIWIRRLLRSRRFRYTLLQEK